MLEFLLAFALQPPGAQYEVGELRSDSSEAVTIQYRGTAFLRGATRTQDSFIPVEWGRTPSARNILGSGAEASPARAQASLLCAIGSNGELRDCRVDEIFPDDVQLRQDMQRLAAAFSTTGEFATLVGDRLKFIGFDLSISNRGGRETPPGCIRAFCTITPAPPPPPQGERGG